jgi:hypothetical protein
MSDKQMTVEVRFAWWLRPWLGALAFFCVLTGAAPDMDKVARTVRRAVRVRCK